jgi:transposase-like protein
MPDEILKDYKSSEDILGKDGVIKRRFIALIERAMNAELTVESGYNSQEPKQTGDRRNGSTSKTVRTESRRNDHLCSKGSQKTL